MRNVKTLLLLAFLVLASLTVLGGEPASAVKAASTLPQGTAIKGAQVVPTRQQTVSSHAVTPEAGPPYGSGDLTFHGLEDQAPTPIVYLIFWGPTWNNGSGGLTPDAQLVQQYFQDLSGSGLQNILTSLHANGFEDFTNQITYGGTAVDFSAPPNSGWCGGYPTVNASDIDNEVWSVVTQSHPDWLVQYNATYYVFTPSNMFVNDQGDCSEASYCGYHDPISSIDAPLAVIPYPFDLSACGGLPSSPNDDIYGDTLVNIASQLQFDSNTDPEDQGGWYDADNLEISNKCAYDFSAGPTTLNNGGVFEVQTEYSNISHSCVNSLDATMRTSPTNINLVTSPGNSPNPQTVMLSNVGSSLLNWSAGTLPSWVNVDPSSGTLAPGASQPLTLTFDTPDQTTYTTSLTLSDPAASNSPLSIPITVVSANVAKTWYFAEGYTGGSFTEYLTLANPNSVAANVTVTYLLGSGKPPITKPYTVPANNRSTVLVNGAVGKNQNVSMVVTSDQSIVAERPMYFDFTGLSGITIPGGTDVLGATQLATNFDFGYLDTTTNHATYLTLLNQNTTTMTATIQYFPAAGGSPITRTHTIAANSRGTVFVNTDVPKGTYSALVTLSEPGLVERPLYLKDSSTGFTGSADVVGVAAPQTRWDFAEGYTSSTFSERYILSNPGITATSATVTFFLSNGTTKTQTVSLNPGQQVIVNANNVLGSGGVNNSAEVTAGAPILAERFMSFKYTGPAGTANGSSIPGATDVLGASAPSNLFYFAEGYSGKLFGEYLTIENPDPTNIATVQVTFLPTTGSPVVRIYTIAPKSRFTLYTNSVMSNQSFSMVVESNVAIVAERPMYFVYNGGPTGGSDVIGYQP